MMAQEFVLSPGENIKPEFSIDEVKVFLGEIFGLACLKIDELNGYDDKNYKVVGVGEECLNDCLIDGFILKIMNSLDSRNLAFVEGCNALLQFLEKNNINSPKLLPTKTGSYYAIKSRNTKSHVVRLLEFIPGTPLHQIQPTEDLFYQSGQFIAQLDLIMKDFHHPAYDTHTTIWHLDSTPKLRNFTFALQNENKQKMVLRIVKEFEERVLKVRDRLESGMIHGDFNEQNVLVEEIDGKWMIKAILDFGDSHYSCYLYELAIAVTYMMLLRKDVAVGGHVIAGYLSVKQISPMELELLKICICARLCQSLVIGEYTYLHQPENLYLLTTAGPGWELLTKLWNQTEEETTKTWSTIINKYS